MLVSSSLGRTAAVAIFKACDIRGVYPDELDERRAKLLGRALGTELDGADCVVGGDVRTSTPALKAALIGGLTASGTRVIDIGTAPTPVCYWARRRLGVRGAAIVTASHNPPEYNGLKFMLGDLPVTPGDVERVRRRVEAGEFQRGRGRAERRDVRDEYLRWIEQRFAGTGAGQTVLVDAGSGTASHWAPEAFRRAGYQVDTLFCEPDGCFPNRSPNPTAPGALAAASAIAAQAEPDFAACFDGDGDRVVFLDETGHVVTPEQALILLARHLVPSEPGAAVVYDQKCTRAVAREVKRAGGRPLAELSGHAFIKRRLTLEGALLAGEVSGHFYFRELGGDDGIYAALVLGELIARSGRTLAELRRRLPHYYISEDIRLHRPRGDGQAVIARLKAAFADLPQDDRDGVRLEFDGGWALVRPSVTEPAITVRVEGDTPERMEEIKRQVLDAIPD